MGDYKWLDGDAYLDEDDFQDLDEYYEYLLVQQEKSEFEESMSEVREEFCAAQERRKAMEEHDDSDWFYPDDDDELSKLYAESDVDEHTESDEDNYKTTFAEINTSGKPYIIQHENTKRVDWQRELSDLRKKCYRKSEEIAESKRLLNVLRAQNKALKSRLDDSTHYAYKQQCEKLGHENKTLKREILELKKKLEILENDKAIMQHRIEEKDYRISVTDKRFRITIGFTIGIAIIATILLLT